MAYTNIDDPSAHFQIALYTGNNSNNVITNDGNSDLQPDFIWAKSRTSTPYADNHFAVDSSRGVQQGQVINESNAATNSVSGTDLKSFNTDGFTVGAVNQTGALNAVDALHVAWQWKANGGTTASNSDGSITSTVQANHDAGFSIVTYAGTGVYNKTVGHGLGATPAVVIVKNRTSAEPSYDDWWVYHKDTSSPANRALRLNENGAEQSSTVFWSVVPSSTIFGVGGSVDAPRYTNGASQNYLAYCFAEKQGYSKFGSYVGNGNANGTFVYTGFTPAWVMTKERGAAGAWVMYDNKRSTTANPQDKYFSADTFDAEATYTQYDFVSNGFKFRSSGSENSNGNTHIYLSLIHI